MPHKFDCDVAVIGAGPAGSLAAKMLSDAGRSVVALESSHFPRFSIGESLLPYCMNILESAGVLPAITQAGFQHKNGAVFRCADEYRDFDFREKFEGGWGTTFQVQRAAFDDLLAREAIRAGADVRFGARVEGVDLADGDARLSFVDNHGSARKLRARFVLDASGFGRILPRLLDLETPSEFPSRTSLFVHIEDHISDSTYDRDKILITVHPGDHGIWYWLIPFSDGTSSLGVVFQPDADSDTEDDSLRLWRLVNETGLGELLSAAEPIREVGKISGYARNVRALHGPGFALLGNAAEFLDPVFSSGVTIAVKSAALAVPVLTRELDGETVDWNKDFASPLCRGVDTFRAYVDSWYRGHLQKIIFNHPEGDSKIRRMVVSVLAGYAWNEDNPQVREPEEQLDLLYQLCS